MSTTNIMIRKRPNRSEVWIPLALKNAIETRVSVEPTPLLNHLRDVLDSLPSKKSQPFIEWVNPNPSSSTEGKISIGLEAILEAAPYQQLRSARLYSEGTIELYLADVGEVNATHLVVIR